MKLFIHYMYYVLFIEFFVALVVFLVHCLEDLNSMFILECYLGFCWIIEKINSNYEMIFITDLSWD